tara:strand:- start:4101 stop:4238 length:138 start_codon:yes stop_codon:yes gene_type:complete
MTQAEITLFEVHQQGVIPQLIVIPLQLKTLRHFRNRVYRCQLLYK